MMDLTEAVERASARYWGPSREAGAPAWGDLDRFTQFRVREQVTPIVAAALDDSGDGPGESIIEGLLIDLVRVTDERDRARRVAVKLLDEISNGYRNERT